MAELYGVETKRVNEALKNNPEKFPEGYIFQLCKEEWSHLRSNFLTLNEENALNLKSKFSTSNSEESLRSKISTLNDENSLSSENLKSKISISSSDNLKSKILTSSWGGKNKLPKAFTEKGLYMLATILKSPQAVQTTIAIVDAFAKLREVANNLAMLNSIENVEDIETIEPEVIERTGNLITDLFFTGIPTAAETSVEVNLGVMKMKRSVTSENPVFHNEIAEMKQMMKQMQEQLKTLTS